MKMEEGLIFACILNGKGDSHSLTWDEINKWSSQQGPIWIHLDRTGTDSHHWLQEKSGLSPIVAEALLEEETRPRIMVLDDSLFLTLRGVNLNPGAEPDDMISIRLYIEADRVITVRHRPLMTIQDIRSSLGTNNGPKNSGEFLTVLVDRLIDRMVISFRRYISPQREVISQLHHAQLTWLNSTQRASIREVADHLIRYVEDLDAARDRMGVMQEELTNKLSEQMNKTMYILTVLAGIFLPITFVTGLLGINVGGIPGAENPWAFTEVALTLTFVAVLLVGIFRWLKWL
jgi:zinc transporter